MQKVECYKCKKLLAEQLVLPKGLCVYCAADETDTLPKPATATKSKKKKINFISKGDDYQIIFTSQKSKRNYIQKFLTIT